MMNQDSQAQLEIQPRNKLLEAEPEIEKETELGLHDPRCLEVLKGLFEV